jgi:hypothetical protein
MRKSLKGLAERLKVAAAAAATVIMGSGVAEQAHAQGYFTVECRGPDGVLKWSDTFPNVVTTVGGNDILDKYLAGSAYTAANYMGLIGAVSYTGVPVIADTMASHGTWTEAGGTNAPTYSQSARPTCAWSSAASKSKALSSALTFSITSTGTAKGVFLTTVATKDGTTGTLISAGLFTGGDKAVANLDTLSVSYSLGV